VAADRVDFSAKTLKKQKAPDRPDPGLLFYCLGFNPGTFSAVCFWRYVSTYGWPGFFSQNPEKTESPGSGRSGAFILLSGI